ncbi:hypothetical protein E2I00_015268 [Balaenoptera physalus]|uniref:Proline dehydrogenase n=1 Tax=Balaenoptera physalus TaxID=9770 RepID=A0A643C2G5_BALPH|nr:hypothetical protein E2I00_015268 [Balaenoptera physalus]
MLWTCRVLCSQAGPSPGGWKPLSFDGGAFHLKGTGELTRALLVLRLCAWPPLVTHGLALQAWSQRLLGSQLSGALLRASIYGQFVAGETTEEVRGCVQQLQTLGLRPLLAVPTEEEPDSAVKTGPGGSLELSPERLAEAMDSGRDLQVSCLNAEQTRHLQASLSRLHRVVQAADRAGLAFGVKLVRGAYLDKEREVARLQGTEDPTQPDYKATNQSYSRCLELMLTQVSHRGPMCPLMVASHNEDSVHQATKRMWELGIPLDGPVCFGQLLGMCDHVSLALGMAQENRSVLRGARREQELLSQELRRRLLGRGLRVPH